MGHMVEPFICNSLAKGIRRAYLEALERNWAIFKKREASEVLRNPYLTLHTHKAFTREISRFCQRRMPRFLSIAQLRAKSGHKDAWCALTLNKEGSFGGTSVIANVMTYPRFRAWRTALSIEFTGHAIDRLIQRAHVVDLPITDEDLNAIHAGFSSSLIWATAALTVLQKIDQKEASGLDILIPGEQGIFLGNYEIKNSRLVLKTFIENTDLWEEEIYALQRLSAFTDDHLAMTTFDLLTGGWVSASNSHMQNNLVEIWKAFGWIIRERQERPSKLDEAWALRPINEKTITNLTEQNFYPRTHHHQTSP